MLHYRSMEVFITGIVEALESIFRVLLEALVFKEASMHRVPLLTALESHEELII